MRISSRRVQSSQSYSSVDDPPFVDSLGLAPLVMTIIGVVAFVLKVVGLLFVFIWVRWSIPRFRYDQLMDLGWKVLLPLGIANVVLTALEKMYLMQ